MEKEQKGIKIRMIWFQVLIFVVWDLIVLWFRGEYVNKIVVINQIIYNKSK